MSDRCCLSNCHCKNFLKKFKVAVGDNVAIILKCGAPNTLVGNIRRANCQASTPFIRLQLTAEFGNMPLGSILTINICEIVAISRQTGLIPLIPITAPAPLASETTCCACLSPAPKTYNHATITIVDNNQTFDCTVTLNTAVVQCGFDLPGSANIHFSVLSESGIPNFTYTSTGNFNFVSCSTSILAQVIQFQGSGMISSWPGGPFNFGYGATLSSGMHPFLINIGSPFGNLKISTTSGFLGNEFSIGNCNTFPQGCCPP